MIFKTMKLEDRQRLVEGHEDLLSEEKRREDRYFSDLSCIRCGEKVFAVLNAKRPFKEGRLLPNTLAKCGSCETEFEPYTKIEVTPPRVSPDLV